MISYVLTMKLWASVVVDGDLNSDEEGEGIQELFWGRRRVYALARSTGFAGGGEAPLVRWCIKTVRTRRWAPV